MGVLGYLMGFLAYLFGVLSYLMGVLGYVMGPLRYLIAVGEESGAGPPSTFFAPSATWAWPGAAAR